jgi:hypothetical protein
MTFDLRDILNTAGPTASLVFASWIFLSLINQRLASAMDRYRALVAEMRADPTPSPRMQEVERQIALYRARCDLMRRSISVSIVAAECLLVTLLTSMISLVDHALAWIGYISLGSTFAGILLLMESARLMLRENRHIKDVLHSEMVDIPCGKLPE